MVLPTVRRERELKRRRHEPSALEVEEWEEAVRSSLSHTHTWRVRPARIESRVSTACAQDESQTIVLRLPGLGVPSRIVKRFTPRYALSDFLALPNWLSRHMM